MLNFEITDANGVYTSNCPFPGCGSEINGLTKLTIHSRMIKHIAEAHEGARFVIIGGWCPCGRRFDRWVDTPPQVDKANMEHLIGCSAFASDLTLRAMAKLGDND